MNNAKIERNVTFFASLGSVLEYYDFVVYGMMSRYLSTIFFPQQNESNVVLQSFLVFALGYLARPFGGAFVGIIGDRIGRKPAFLFLTLLMTSSTLAIGLLPGYSEIGLWAPALLVFFRLLQGLSFGGELPGATTIVAELSLAKRRSLRQSFIVASVSLGALMATFILFLLTSYLSESDIIAGGWRIPFIVGGVLGIFVFWARRGLVESPVFLASKTNVILKNPLEELVKNWTSIITGVMLTVFGAAMIVTNLFFPYYIGQQYQFSQKEIYFAITISFIFSVLILPFTGLVADRVSRTKMLSIICFAYCLFSVTIFQLLVVQTTSCLILFMIIHQLFIALFSSSYFPIMIDLFPTSVRYTGIAICYNITYAVMGTLPAGLTALLLKYQTPACVPMILSIMAGVTGLASLYLSRAVLRSRLIHFVTAKFRH